MRKYHKDGTLPDNAEVWVFGSNLAGIHGAGAAKVALDRCGAVFGIGAGPSGMSYAIPTKDQTVQRSLPLETVELYIYQFIEYASFACYVDFFVTRIGCGFAGFHDDQIAPLFKETPLNCSFAEDWKKHLD